MTGPRLETRFSSFREVRGGGGGRRGNLVRRPEGGRRLFVAAVPPDSIRRSARIAPVVGVAGVPTSETVFG